MALIGMLVVLVRAFKNGGSFESAVTTGLVWMTVLGIVGAMIGGLAEMTVVESVRLRIANEVETVKQARQQRAEEEAKRSAASTTA